VGNVPAVQQWRFGYVVYFTSLAATVIYIGAHRALSTKQESISLKCVGRRAPLSARRDAHPIVSLRGRAHDELYLHCNEHKATGPGVHEGSSRSEFSVEFSETSHRGDANSRSRRAAKGYWRPSSRLRRCLECTAC
jgi:hypothetical protein